MNFLFSETSKPTLVLPDFLFSGHLVLFSLQENGQVEKVTTDFYPLAGVKNEWICASSPSYGLHGGNFVSEHKIFC